MEKWDVLTSQEDIQTLSSQSLSLSFIPSLAEKINKPEVTILLNHYSRKDVCKII